MHHDPCENEEANATALERTEPAAASREDSRPKAKHRTSSRTDISPLTSTDTILSHKHKDHAHLETIHDDCKEPYKHLGYPGFANYIASDDEFCLFRRFGALNTRVILTLQNEIEAEEAKLKELDEQCASDPDQHALLNSLTWDKDTKNPHPERAIQLKKIQRLLQEYNQYLATYARLVEKPTAVKHQRRSIKNWILNRSNPEAKHSGPIRDEELVYLDAGADLICLSSHRKSTITRQLEKTALVEFLRGEKSHEEDLDDDKLIALNQMKMKADGAHV